MFNTQYESQSPRSGRRFLAYLLSFVTLMQPVMPSIAAVLPDGVIEEEVNSQPQFLPSGNSAWQLKTPEFIEWSTPVATSIGSFRQALFESNRGALGDSTFVPIATGDITTIIPIFSRYKSIGTEAVQSRYIRSQIQALIGRHLIDSATTAYRNEASQLDTLYANALTYSRANPSIKFGDRLQLAQDASGLEADLVWPELRHINGEDVLVPIVYLKESTVSDRKVVSNQEELAETTSFGTLTIRNASISASRTRFLEVAGDLALRDASIQSDADLKIVAGGAFDNISSVVSAKNDLVIGAHSINNRTIVYRYDTGHEQGTRYGEISALASSQGDVILRSYSDIIFAGADAIASQGEMKLMADGSIFIGAQELYSGSESRYGNGTQTRSAISYLQSHLSARETIQLVANGQIVIDAAEITSENGHIELLAGMGVSVLDRLGQEQSQATGKFGKKSVEESIYQTVAIRSLLDAGKGVKLSTDFGDITLKAADISSTEGASVRAKNGSVNLLMTTETDHYSYSSVKKGLFTTETVSKGRNIETGVPNSIVGGLSVEALNGISVEYEGDPALSLDQQLDEISGMEGMSWVNDVRNHPDVDWNAVALAQEQWYDKNTSISPAFAALITIAVAIATSGAGTAFAGVLGAAEGGAIAAAVSAGTSAFISQATLAAANGAVNGDMEGAFDDFTSNDTLKSLAIAMVTAGAIAKVDAAFFNADASAIDGAQSAVDSAATTGQAQAGVDAALAGTETAARSFSLGAQAAEAVTHAAVRAGAESIIAGAEFDDVFIRSLAQNALNTLGESLATKIGAAKANQQINVATQYVAHAAVGCLVGTATATLDDGETQLGCASGAGGAVIGEVIGKIYAEDLEEDLEAWVADKVSGGGMLDREAVMAQAMEFKSRGVDMAKLGAALTAFAVGGDVNIAADAGYNAAENNAFFLVAIVAVVAYTSYVSSIEGSLYGGLQAIGRGDDPLAQAINSAAEAGVELAAEHYPEETRQVAQVLGAAGETISAGVAVVMQTETGETVTRYWNEIPEADRNAIIGGASVVSMVIPAGALAKLRTLSKLDVEPGDWIKDRDHPNWNLVSEQDRNVLDAEYHLAAQPGSERNPLLADALPRNGNRFVLDQGPVPTCGHNACAMTLDSLGVSVDPARLVQRLAPGDSGIDGNDVKALFRSEGVNASFVPGRTVERLDVLTTGVRPVVVRLEEGNFSHWVVVDGITTRGATGQRVVAIRDSAGGKSYFSPIESFTKYFTGEVVIPNP